MTWGSKQGLHENIVIKDLCLSLHIMRRRFDCWQQKVLEYSTNLFSSHPAVCSIYTTYTITK